MRVLAFDPGAKRMGWAVIESAPQTPTYIASSYSLHERTEKYQPYRMRLLEHWVPRTADLLNKYKPDIVATEIVPPIGFGSSGGAVQSQLASAAITSVQAVVIIYQLPITQVSATTMKKAMTGVGDATKPKVRDGVIALLPELAPRKKEWSGPKAIWEEPDACGVGLAALGYSHVDAR